MEHNIRPEDVSQIRVWAGTRDVEHTGDEAKRYPRNKESADHSSYYCTARIVLDRTLGPAQFTPEKLLDPRIRELSDKIIFQADPKFDREGVGGMSEIITKQGASYKCRVEYPKGHPHNPMTDEELEEKFRAMASEYMPETQVWRIIESIDQLEKIEDIGSLMRIMVFDAADPR